MCRNIKPLFNYEPPVSNEEIRNAATQYVRKISGFTKPSKANEAVFLAAISAVETASTNLLHNLQTQSPPRNRESEIAHAKMRSIERFQIKQN